MFMKGGKMSIGGLKKFIESTYDDKTDEIDGYIIDRHLSTMHTKVFYNPDSKILICVERPTSDKRDILSDVIAGLDITGLLFKKIDSRYRNSFKVYKQALSKYNSRNSSILIGYSLGALVSEEWARSNPNSFNEYILVSKPVIPSRVLSKLPKGTTEVRSTLDPVNLLKPLQQKSDRELVIKAETFNPIKEHRIDNVFPRISQDLEVGDENIISGTGTGNNKFKKYNQYKMDSYEGYGIRKWYTEREIRGMDEKELKSAIRIGKKYIPKKYHNRQLSETENKNKEELQETLRQMSKYLAGDNDDNPVLKKRLVLEPFIGPMIEGGGIRKWFTEREIKNMDEKELKEKINRARRYIPIQYRNTYLTGMKNGIRDKTKEELQESLREISKYLAGDNTEDNVPRLKKYLVLERMPIKETIIETPVAESVIEGAGYYLVNRRLTEQEMKKYTVKELKRIIVQNRKYADPEYKEDYKVSNKNKNELKEIIRKMNLIPK